MRVQGGCGGHDALRLFGLEVWGSSCVVNIDMPIHSNKPRRFRLFQGLQLNSLIGGLDLIFQPDQAELPN